ncbi:hypothetical protein D9758_007875 [Tetrapyrgos nigripes]|uniref:DNA-directed RNA polymerase n=1 Tax=Tetrapyrgos nigripes TaxID=182062 RepID=A0A8H5D575_9AGAR|nr:hypothetical protein D9758_007875 [Tetrapyrgos nigripes]
MLRRTRLLSRQSLPRPARFYSTPSRKASAALATQQVPHTQPDYEFITSSRPTRPHYSSSHSDLESFLNSPPRLTLLPTPRPDQSTSSQAWWFSDSQTQDLLAVMDACLHQLHDVPRAKEVFTRLRKEAVGASRRSVLDPRLYNAFLEAYLNMASTPGKGAANRDYWMESAWELYDAMESDRDGVEPTTGTYATMFLSILRFGPDSPSPIPVTKVGALSAKTLLQSLARRGISVENVVADRVFGSARDVDGSLEKGSREARGVIRILSRAAVDTGMLDIVHQLNAAEEKGQRDEADDVDEALAGVPEARAVLKEVKPDPANPNSSPTYEVPFNLENLRRHLTRVSFARRILPEDIVSRQKLLEESVYDVAVARLQHENKVFEDLGLGQDEKLRNPDLRRYMWEWHCKLQVKLKDVVKSLTTLDQEEPMRRRNKNYANMTLSPYLSLVNPSRLSLITILEIMRLSGSGGVSEGMKTTRALIQVGKAVEMEYKAQMCRKYGIWVPSSSSPTSQTQTGAAAATSGRPGHFSQLGYSSLQERRLVAAKHSMEAESWTAEWTQMIRAKVGGILVECLMEVAEVVRTAVKNGQEFHEVQPAFYHSYEHHRGQKLGVIRLNPAVSERIANDSVRETLHPRQLPMLIKPRNWIAPTTGGYLYSPVQVMRYKDSVEQAATLKKADREGHIEHIYTGLDVLGSTPWKINRKVFDVVLQVWNSGERLGKLPPVVHDEPEPEPPAPEDVSVKSKTNYVARMKSWTQAKANTHSDRCNVNYKIEIARTFLGDTIYFPHNIDFRGRAYPIPPHLNHIGDDLSRGLLIFADGKPLGERGMRWLKIHIANLYGFDKANFDERVKFVDDRLDEIRDSAEKPLEGQKWWSHADDPWQCLGACMELTAALDSPDPLKFVSCLPVHQDGTCNGLQHYAALGGDSRGAAQVNLAAGDRPSDVYTYVGRMAEVVLEKDAEKGEKYALLLKGKITRKLVKQTVMTTVYGVTFIGAREQIEKQIRVSKMFAEEDVWGVSAYLAKVVLACIGDLFTGAKDIQTWLTLCARLIAKSIDGKRIKEALEEYRAKKTSARSRKSARSPSVDFLRKEQMTSVIWTTPLGLPVVQPYRKPKRKQILTSMQSVYISDPNVPSEVNTMKQASAFPPNFIHSLDATHMMMTALECRAQGLTFAAVHDSYWTHACDIDNMSTIIRNTFIGLHSSDVLTRLHNEFMDRYKDYKIPLVHLRTGVLNKALRDAGSKMVLSPEQAKKLGINLSGKSTSSGLGKLVKISEEEKSSLDESEDSEKLKELLNELSADTEEVASSIEAKEDNAEEDEYTENDFDQEENDEDDEYESPRARAQRLRKLQEEKVSKDLMGKFVNLTDLIPPLPKKGDFNVQAIKASQYFFS